MGPARFPAVGDQVRRRTDGILGEVQATDPPHNLISVRWATDPGAYAWEEITVDLFARSWELTGKNIPPPRETHVAVSLIAALVFFFLGGIVLHDSSKYQAYDLIRPLSSDAPEVLNSAQALDNKYGLQAAESCAQGADDYVRSITNHIFYWDNAQTLIPRFDQFGPTVASPGVLTMISDQARVSDGFGTFKPIRIYCNYDTQSEDVLSYASADLKP